MLDFSASSGIKLNLDKSQWIKRDGTWLTSLKFLGKRFIPANLLTGEQLNLQMEQDGILQSATRTPKVYTFEDYALIQEAVIYDMNKLTTSVQKPTSDNFLDWFKSKYFGFVSSRIYNGNFDVSQIEQDFSYSFKKGTWSDYGSRKPEQEIELNIFNSGSIALSALLSYHERCQNWGTFK